MSSPQAQLRWLSISYWTGRWIHVNETQLTAPQPVRFPRRSVVVWSGTRWAPQPDQSAIQDSSISLLRRSMTSSTTIRGERYHVFEAMALHRVWNSRVTFSECANQVTCFLFWFLLYFNWHQDWNGGFRISPHFFSGRVRRLSWYLHGLFLNDDLRWSCLCRS